MKRMKKEIITKKLVITIIKKDINFNYIIKKY